MYLLFWLLSGLLISRRDTSQEYLSDTVFYFYRKMQAFSEMEITSLLFKINSACQNELIAMHSVSFLIQSQPF